MRKKSKKKSKKELNFVDLYLKLEKLVNQKSKSIDLNKRRKRQKQHSKKKSDFLSEDKAQTKYIIRDNIPYYFNKENKIQNRSIRTLDKKDNKYFQILIQKFKNLKEINFMAKLIKKKFKK